MKPDSGTDRKARRKAAAHQERQRRWRKWLESEGASLLRIELPNEILQDEDHWNDFCTHACLHMHPSASGFSVDEIPDADGQRLLDFLEDDLTPEEKPYSALYNVLRKRLRDSRQSSE